MLRGNIPSTKDYFEYDIKLLLVKLQLWNYGKSRVSLHCYYSQVHSEAELKDLLASYQ